MSPSLAASPIEGEGWAVQIFHGGSVQLGDRQSVGLGANFDRFLAARQRLGDRLQRHALLRKRVQLVDLGRRPRLFMALELVFLPCVSGSVSTAMIAIASSRP